MAGNDSANKEHHKIVELTNQKDGGQEAEHSTIQKCGNQQHAEQHDQSKKAYRITKKVKVDTDLNGSW